MTQIYQRGQSFVRILAVTGTPEALNDGKQVCETVMIQAEVSNAENIEVGSLDVRTGSGIQIGPGEDWEWEIPRVRELLAIMRILEAGFKGLPWPDQEIPRLWINMGEIGIVGTAGDEVRVWYTYPEETGL